MSEEVRIYEKLLHHSSLSTAPCAPGTLDMMAQFSVLTRLKEPENSSIYSKLRVYDGESLKDVDPKAKALQEYKDYAGTDEGMTGVSTRFAYKILSSVFNYDQTEVAANPVHLMYVLEQRIGREDYPDEVRRRYLEFIKGYLAPRYAEFIGKEIQTAYLESYSEYGQNIFDRYVTFADCWIQDEEFRDPETGESFDRSALNDELEKIEKPAGIANPKDFRNEIVNFVLRAAPTTTAAIRPGPAMKAARSDREEDVLEHGRPAAGDLVQRQGIGRGQVQASEFRRPDGREGIHGEAGPTAVRVVPPCEEVFLSEVNHEFTDRSPS